MFKALLAGLRALVEGRGDQDWDFLERRELIRIRCHYDVEFSVKGKKHKGSVVDMGMQGMKLRCFAPLKKGEEVSVTYPIEILDACHQTIRCKVLWVRKRDRDFVTFAGLGYNEEDQIMSKSWVKSLLKQLGFGNNRIFQKRKAVRAECFIPVEAVYGHAKVSEGRIYNLGVGGALVEAPKDFGKGNMVELRIGPFEELEQFTITGAVVVSRQQGGLYLQGVQFGELKERTVDVLGRYLIHLLNNHWCD
ncbi:MAG: PilZ domain-containing protein [Candidatus Eremiobacteraeota bacterium]|nr:PilZ domain-containing protein [Candidatus Eremiobacteraeota bacterium]